MHTVITHLSRQTLKLHILTTHGQARDASPYVVSVPVCSLPHYRARRLLWHSHWYIYKYIYIGGLTWDAFISLAALGNYRASGCLQMERKNLFSGLEGAFIGEAP